jgi:hypothetical protein
MSLTSQVKRLISRIEETLCLDEASERAIKAHNALEGIKDQISAEEYKNLELSLGLAELKSEDNYFSGYSGYYH